MRQIGVFHLLCGDLAVRGGGQRQHFVTRRFHRAGLVHVDVSGVRTQRTLVRAKNRCNNGGIRLRAADEKMHVHVLATACFADLRARQIANFVLAVADSLHHIRFTKAL